MSTYYRRTSREFRVTLTNGKTLRIVAPSIQRAYTRAGKWCEKLGEGVTIKNVHEIIDGGK